ncbi:MAG: arginine--tRNA ligase [Chloroflexi bacterium]|nr:arginine--tRNA ligase [Chloroflexota bacterium]
MPDKEKMIRDEISQIVKKALSEAQRTEILPQADVDEIAIERPQNPGHGDFACSLPMKLARPMRMNPLSIAEKIASFIPAEGLLGGVEVAAPGFINFSLRGDWLSAQVDEILNAGESFGNLDLGAGQRVQVEFVSGNPTGPLHVAHARGGVIGSALANVLEAAGYEVEREYYFNDSGNQVELFKRSLYARYQQALGLEAEVPEDGYHGEYLVELAQDIKASEGDRFLKDTDGAREELGKLGLDRMMQAIRDDVDGLRIHFDVWFNEASLYSGGQYERSMKLLEDNGYVTKADGATWFASTALGDEKDNVLVRSSGMPTYFATDVAYHYNKFIERKFDRVINVWGADHQGHIPRMKHVISAFGLSPDRLTVIVNQIVTLKREGQVVRLSKRTGDMISLRELLDEVGVDACRFFFLSRSPESQMEFDLELAKQESSENPVYYVQYAHARIASILRLAEEREIDFEEADLSLLTHDAELDLIRKMLVLPELIEMMSRSLEPHHLPHYSMELANAFHWFYQNCRVVSSVEGEEELTKSRLKLARAAKVVLARCLDLMSMSAPEQM